MQQKQNFEQDYQFNGEIPYTLFPSISSQKTVCGKTYYVRRFFNGDKDFEKTMQRLAVNQTYKNMR